MKLKDYLFEQQISQNRFASSVGVSREMIRLYVAEISIPRRDVMERIVAETSGAVQPNDFFEKAVG